MIWLWIIGAFAMGFAIGCGLLLWFIQWCMGRSADDYTRL